jgi:demethylmenaquinone methyltransferase / 2-methoxy-6-polyprenyl-1,4-benzoquinol methylase
LLGQSQCGIARFTLQLNQVRQLSQPERVRQMFRSIAHRYDLANHVLSCGADFYWRRRAAQIVASWRPNKIVDLATGTGDLALAIARKLPDADITAVDLSEEMLGIARQKGLPEALLADATQLPFPDASFDCVTIAFGLRNIENYGAAIREMSRVLNEGGHLLILEFSLPRLAILRTVYRIYLHRCLPLIGSFLTRKKSAYDYLGDSIEEFPSGLSMLRFIEGNGFGRVAAEPLTGGIVTIYTASRKL